MSTPETQRAYTEGYHVGYRHGQEAAGAGQGGNQGGHQNGFSSGYPIDLVAHYPERSSRLLMFFAFFKPFLLIPHLIVLWFLSIGASLVMVIAWFAVVITGNYPHALWDFMVGIHRWTIRLQAWMMGLTDKYPPFSLK